MSLDLLLNEEHRKTLAASITDEEIGNAVKKLSVNSLGWDCLPKTMTLHLHNHLEIDEDGDVIYREPIRSGGPGSSHPNRFSLVTCVVKKIIIEAPEIFLSNRLILIPKDKSGESPGIC